MLLELIVGMAISFFIMFLWYITQPITVGIINRLFTTATNLGVSNTYLSNGVTILRYICYWWGPLLVIGIIILWLYGATQREDPSSQFVE